MSIADSGNIRSYPNRRSSQTIVSKELPLLSAGLFPRTVMEFLGFWSLHSAVAACVALVGWASTSFVAFGAPRDSSVMEQLNDGVSKLERYEYIPAYEVFSRIAQEHPEWAAAHVNRGLAALNAQGEYFAIAEESFQTAIRLNPKGPHAWFLLGLYYYHVERFADSFKAFTRVTTLDPYEPFAHYYRGSALIHLRRVDDARLSLETALRLQPSLSSAYYRLRSVYVKSQDRKVGLRKARQVVGEFKRLELQRVGLKADVKYSSAGRYSLAIRNETPPGAGIAAVGWRAPVPKFGAPRSLVSRPALSRRRPDGVTQSPAFALGDLTGDGRLDVVLAGVTAGEGSAVAVEVQEPDGRFHQSALLEVESTAVALGDIDGDIDLDLVAAGPDTLTFYSGDGAGAMTKTSWQVNGGVHNGFPVCVVLTDADSDWDLDVLCLRQEAGGDGSGIRSRLELLNNNRDGTLTDISVQAKLGPLDFPVAGMVVADLDADIDVDVVVFDRMSGRSVVFVNERVWRYRMVEGESLGMPVLPELRHISVGDFDGDRVEDLVCFTTSGIHFVRTLQPLGFEEDESFAQRFSTRAGVNGMFADLTGGLQPGLLVWSGEASGDAAPFFLYAPTGSAVKLDSLGVTEPPVSMSAAFTALGHGANPELLTYDDRVGLRAFPLVVEGSWLAVDLQGPTQPRPDKERANVAGMGAVVEVRAGDRAYTTQLHCGASGPVRLPPRVLVGLAGRDFADYVRVLWPDGVLQSERRLVAGRLHPIREVDRKPSSCPVLFAWDGQEFAFVGDFLGVGGLGFFEGPDTFFNPDPTEMLLLPPLVPRREGDTLSYQLEIIEPLEECTYLDSLRLTVVDHPTEWSVLPNEMFAVSGPVPEYELLAIDKKLFPQLALNSYGAEVTERILTVDRRYGNTICIDRRFSGRAREEHEIVFDFGTALDEFSVPGTRPFLFLHGYIEYGYSTSNFAATQAAASFVAPSFEVERDGRWVTLRREWGFPAGTPRYMAVDLVGLLRPGDRRLRVRTNMEIYWDQVFIGNTRKNPSLDVVELDPDVAELSFAGFVDEKSPDGLKPKIFSWPETYSPLASFKVMPGRYTRFGDVRELLRHHDDQFVVFGPGDRIRLRVDASRLAPPAAGKRRTFLLKTGGYCKDMDLYTGHPERVEPLPFAAMSAYPYASGESYPSFPALRRYRERWNTRVVRGTFFDGFDRLK